MLPSQNLKTFVELLQIRKRGLQRNMWVFVVLAILFAAGYLSASVWFSATSFFDSKDVILLVIVFAGFIGHFGSQIETINYLIAFAQSLERG